MIKIDYSPWLTWIDDQYQEMLDTTITLANINSDSLNAEGVNAVADRLADYCQQTLEVSANRIELPPLQQVQDNGELVELPLGRALRLSHRPQAPIRIFFCAHLDTVFAANHPFQRCRWLDADTLNGPGVTDLKGGILVLIKGAAGVRA